MEQLADLVEENADFLTQYEGLNANLDPEKPNVISGANPGAAPRPEKENVETGR